MRMSCYKYHSFSHGAVSPRSCAVNEERCGFLPTPRRSSLIAVGVLIPSPPVLPLPCLKPFQNT